MAKILKDKELVDIVRRAVHDEGEIKCADAYAAFIEDLADLVCKHFGGERGSVQPPDDVDGSPWTVAIRLNDSVPENGGAFARYDRDVTWQNGVET